MVPLLMTSTVDPPLRKPLSIGLHGTTLIAFVAASGAPSPLYRLYQQNWGFSPLILTVVFAVYALALLTALLSFGSLSDRTGRKPVTLAALALEIAAMTVFLTARDVTWLLFARLLQGFATGLAAASVGAALLDIDREHGALINSIGVMGGMGLGALGSSLLVQFAPAPLRLVFVLLLAIFIVQLIRTALAPETAKARAPGGWLPRPRISVPAQARAEMLAVTPVNVAIWALGGFYLSLMPSLIATTAGSSAAWMGGLAVGALTVSGAIATLIGRNHAPFTVLFVGAAALAAGVGVILAGASLASPTLLLIGPVVAGIGFGGASFGAVRSVMPLAEPHERAGLMAAFYIESYLANALPVVIAGYYVQRVGLLNAADVFGIAIIVLALAAMAIAVIRHRGQRRRRCPA
jgi:MFS family permease